MKLSIIISTYNSEEWLSKVLFGYSLQTENDFEIVIADDGSTAKTKQVIDSYQSKFKNPIVHVWQEDDGFQKTKILNKAIIKSKSDYLLFSDGDCIPRKDFVAAHLKYKQNGYFLSGGYFKLPIVISNNITFDDIQSQNCFSFKWLKSKGMKWNFKANKLINNSMFSTFMNVITPTKRSWNGHNSSGFKKDILAINGFNEEMQYGGEDRELGERLHNNGILSKQIRYSAICLHLEHDRSYSSNATWQKNNEIRKFNKLNKITYIQNGIDKHGKSES
jgi:glycosyltransferase involved in cell wall biosynthesis